MSDLSDKLRAAFEDDARVTAEDIIDVLDELEAAIVERDSIIARLESDLKVQMDISKRFAKVMTQHAEYIEELREGQSATASLERWRDE